MQLGQRRQVAVDREHRLGDDHGRAAGARRRAGPPTRGRVGVRGDHRLGAGHPAAVDQRGVVVRVGDEQGARAGQRPDRAEVGQVARGEDQGLLGAEPVGQLGLQVARARRWSRGPAGSRWRPARTPAGPRTGGRDHRGVARPGRGSRCRPDRPPRRRPRAAAAAGSARPWPACGPGAPAPPASPPTPSSPCIVAPTSDRQTITRHRHLRRCRTPCRVRACQRSSTGPAPRCSHDGVGLDEAGVLDVLRLPDEDLPALLQLAHDVRMTLVRPGGRGRGHRLAEDRRLPGGLPLLLAVRPVHLAGARRLAGHPVAGRGGASRPRRPARPSSASSPPCAGRTSG